MHAKQFAPTLTVSISLAMSACRNGAAESGQPEQHGATQSKQKRQQEANTGYRRDSGQGRNQNEAGFRQLPSQYQLLHMRRQLQQLIITRSKRRIRSLNIGCSGRK